MSDLFQDPNEASKQHILKLKAAISRLAPNDDFKLFMNELLYIQPIDIQGYSDNATVMAYNNGRRSLMVDIKKMFDLNQWHLIESYNVND